MLFITARADLKIAELETVHGFKFLCGEIVFCISSDFFKHILQYKIHHKKRGTCVEGISIKFDGGIPATHDVLLFKDGDVKPSMGKYHCIC